MNTPEFSSSHVEVFLISNQLYNRVMRQLWVVLAARLPDLKDVENTSSQNHRCFKRTPTQFGLESAATSEHNAIFQYRFKRVTRSFTIETAHHQRIVSNILCFHGFFKYLFQFHSEFNLWSGLEISPRLDNSINAL